MKYIKKATLALKVTFFLGLFTLLKLEFTNAQFNIGVNGDTYGQVDPATNVQTIE